MKLLTLKCTEIMANFNITLDRPTNKPFNSNDLKPVFAAMESPAEVTSIPSPFAAMHLHNLAFFAANAQRVQTPNLYSVGTGKELYDKIISHTFDIYELLYFWEKLNLEQKGFSIDFFSIPTEQEINNAQNPYQVDREKHKSFRKTLNLYIDLYKNKLNITDDAFDCGYYLKYNGRIIAETSPLTGFFVSASADYGTNGIQGIIPTNTNIKYLSQAPQTFRQLASRDLEFRKFMCEFIQNYSPHSFTSFRDYILEYYREFSLTPDYNILTIDLNKFGFHPTQTQLQLLMSARITPDNNTRVMKSNVQNIIAIPDRYNNIYFRSLINIKKNIHFKLKPEDYVTEITERKLLGQTTSWLSVNDFFQDNIVELQDAINTERFYCCKVIDQNGNNSDVKVLLPLKKRYFEFFNYNNATFDNLLESRLNIRQVTADEYLATLTIPTARGNVNLQKKYSVAENTIVRLNGSDSLYLGVYPFVKDITNPTNNGFFRIFTYHSKRITSDLKFFKDSTAGMLEIKNDNNERHFTKRTYNHENFQEFPKSTFYALERHYFDKDKNYDQSADKDVNFEIIEIALIKDGFDCNALIVPKFVNKEVNGNVGMLSVDFGTSNTNISIGVNGANQSVSDYDSLITNAQGQQISQIGMLHKPSGNTFDFEATNYGGINENHFLSEFMPTIIQRNHDHYKFSLPTVINLHEDVIDNKCVSLVHSNIPVAYYSKGLRKMGDRPIDKPYSTFKWVGQDARKKSYATLFLDQLLLMARNTLIATGQNPANTIVVYSIPLSFNATERNFYETLWKALAKKYFLEINLHKISESRAPYYASGHHFAADSSVLLDVGGGSTDILFYQDNQVKATTSYAYAANALFSGNRNQNIFMKLLSSKVDEGNMALDMNSVEEISTLQVCDVFNYRFAKREKDVKTAFIENTTWGYLLTLHCSAILYHAFQNNKAILGKNVQLRNLLFSGNGSKLFKLLFDIGNNPSQTNFTNLAKKIVKFVYGSDTSSLNVSFVDDNWLQGVTINSSVGMKASTSIGSLCWKMNLKQDAGTTTDPQIVAIGDENTILDQAQLNSDIEIAKYNVADQTKQKNISDLVTKNFNGFLNGFLGTEPENGTEAQESLFGLGLRTFVPNTPISPAVVRKIIVDTNLIEQSIKDYHLTHPNPEHSVFFVPVQKLIEELSKYFAAQSNT